jgi:hypothetical protein
MGVARLTDAGFFNTVASNSNFAVPLLTGQRSRAAGANCAADDTTLWVSAQAMVGSSYADTGRIQFTYRGDGTTTYTGRVAIYSSDSGGTGIEHIRLDGSTFNLPQMTASRILSTDSSKNLTSLAAVPETLGGTNQTAYTLGDTLYASASNTLSKLAGNTTSTKKFLRQTGTGAVSAAPAWDTLAQTDLPTPSTGHTLGTTYAITANATWEDTGIQVALPSAGTYLVLMTLVGVLNNNTLSASIFAKLQDVTAGPPGTAITDSETFVVRNVATGLNCVATASRTFVVVATAAMTLRVYAQRTTVGTYTTSQIFSSSALGNSVLDYVRIGGN